jgi:hypothetical protein
MIGIKIADGTYIPILEESEKGKKKVILTTVRDDQPSVQIDLYRDADKGMKNPEHLGSLKIDKIDQALKGEPEIELLMSIDEEGNLITTARDLNSDNEKSLAINIESLPETHPYDTPDFELSSSGETADFESSLESSKDTSGAPPYYSPMNGQSVSINEEKNRKPLALIAALALLLAAIVIGLFFLFRRGENSETAAPIAESQPAAPRTTPPPQQPAAPPAPVTPPPSAAVKPQEPPAPPPAAAAPQTNSKPKGPGVWYSIVKGDNLWNLSKSFYKTPWLYPKIAEENDIANPDLIFQNHRIYIPEVDSQKR